MSQEDVFKEVQRLRMTTLQELTGLIDTSVTAITHSLSILCRYEEIIPLKITNRTIYISRQLLEHNLLIENS